MGPPILLLAACLRCPFAAMTTRDSTVLGPLVLLADLSLLLGREVVLDVEEAANLLGRLALDHVGAVCVAWWAGK